MPPSSQGLYSPASVYALTTRKRSRYEETVVLIQVLHKCISSVNLTRDSILMRKWHLEALVHLKHFPNVVTLVDLNSQELRGVAAGIVSLKS